MLRTTLHSAVVSLAIIGIAAPVVLSQDATPAPAAQVTAPAKPAAQNKTAAQAQPAVTAQTPPQSDPAQLQTDGSQPKLAPSQEPEEPKQIVWPFKGMKGYVDKTAAQRGFQVYKQVCSACHSMNLVAYRSLSNIGFSEAEITALAAEKQVEDYDDKGQRIQRPGRASDHLVPPYPNEDASRAANQGAYPPDLSLITKARHSGPNYVYSILTGFNTAPANETPVANKYYNPYFSGHWISMPPPLSEGAVTYQDGTPATVDQMARDVVVFLQWSAEPEMEQRKEMGLKVLLFLFVMSGFFYAAKKRIWSKLEK